MRNIQWTIYRLIAVLAIWFMILPSQAQAPSDAVQFLERKYDFGTIQEKDGKVAHTFKFRNTGTEPVAIVSMTSGCSCVSFDYTKTPVAPGKEGTVKVIYNPAYRPGFFSKEIIVYSRSSSGTKYNRIWIKGTVAGTLHAVEEDYPYNFGNGLYLNLETVIAGKVTSGLSITKKIKFANNLDKTIRLEFINTDKQRIQIKAPGILKPKERGEFTIVYTALSADKGKRNIQLFPVINSKKSSVPMTVIAESK